MDILDYYLDNINEQNKEIQEIIDPTLIIPIAGGVALGVGTIYTIGLITSILLAASLFNKSIKVDPLLSKKINNILKSGNRWVVHKYKDATPNAFALKGNDVFITTGLIKLLNEREQTAALLHETFHNKSLHTWKQVGVESSFVYLIVFVSITSTITIFPGLAFLVAYILKKSVNIAYARLIGRRNEIKADEFATIHGYGHDLISAFNKMEKWAKSKKSNAPCDKICQIQRKISDAIDEHPSTKKRIEIILRKTNKLNQILKNGSFKKISTYVSGVFKNNG